MRKRPIYICFALLSLLLVTTVFADTQIVEVYASQLQDTLVYNGTPGTETQISLATVNGRDVVLKNGRFTFTVPIISQQYSGSYVAISTCNIKSLVLENAILTEQTYDVGYLYSLTKGNIPITIDTLNAVNSTLTLCSRPNTNWKLNNSSFTGISFVSSVQAIDPRDGIVTPPSVTMDYSPFTMDVSKLGANTTLNVAGPATFQGTGTLKGIKYQNATADTATFHNTVRFDNCTISSPTVMNKGMVSNSSSFTRNITLYNESVINDSSFTTAVIVNGPTEFNGCVIPGGTFNAPIQFNNVSSTSTLMFSSESVGSVLDRVTLQGAPAITAAGYATIVRGTITDNSGISTYKVHLDSEASKNGQVTTVKLSNPPVVIDWGEFPQSTHAPEAGTNYTKSKGFRNTTPRHFIIK